MNKEEVNTNNDEVKEGFEKEAPKQEKQEKKQAHKGESERLKSELDKALKELAEQSDKYMRLAAEYDNYRKRSTKEREGIYDDAYANAASIFLPLIDNIERAAEYAVDEGKLSEGVKMLEKQLKDILGKLGITAIVPDGEPFDPEVHNAIMHEEDETKEENTVSQTLQKGYRIGEKVIRHALVKVVN